MKSIYHITLISLLLIAADPIREDAPASQVLKGIKVLNDAFTKGDKEKIKALMTEDHLAITPYYGKPQNRVQQLKTLPELKLSDYVMGQTQISLLSPTVIVVVYPLKLKGTYQGKPISQNYQASSVWVKREGQWLEAHYQETQVGD